MKKLFVMVILLIAAILIIGCEAEEINGVVITFADTTGATVGSPDVTSAPRDSSEFKTTIVPTAETIETTVTMSHTSTGDMTEYIEPTTEPTTEQTTERTTEPTTNTTTAATQAPTQTQGTVYVPTAAPTQTQTVAPPIVVTTAEATTAATTAEETTAEATTAEATTAEATTIAEPASTTAETTENSEIILPRI